MNEVKTGDFGETRVLFDQALVKNTGRFSFGKSPYRVHRVYLDLEGYKSRDLSAEFLNDLATSFARLRVENRQIILRILYDWPDAELVRGGLKARSAITAEPSQMIRHIDQISPVLLAHDAVILAVETGMVGFWGEQHGDVASKQSPAFFEKLFDHWELSTRGRSYKLLVRYNKTLRAYKSSKTAAVAERIGVDFALWNDCLGAYDDPFVDPGSSPAGQILVGETCSLAPARDYSCETMLPYFQRIQLSYLHANYYRTVLEQLKSEGCWSEIVSKLGFDFVVSKPEYIEGPRNLVFTLQNIGWGWLVKPTMLFAKIGDDQSKELVNLASIGPGEKLKVVVPVPGGMVGSALIEISTDKPLRLSVLQDGHRLSGLAMRSHFHLPSETRQ